LIGLLDGAASGTIQSYICLDDATSLFKVAEVQLSKMGSLLEK
jgi:hypothetical protein